MLSALSKISGVRFSKSSSIAIEVDGGKKINIEIHPFSPLNGDFNNFVFKSAMTPDAEREKLKSKSGKEI